MVTGDGLDGTGEFKLDNLWINWTQRVKLPPQIHGIEPLEDQVYRMGQVELVLNLSDEYDSVEELRSVSVHHSPNGTIDWRPISSSSPVFEDGAWRTVFSPKISCAVGEHDFRVWATDSDGKDSKMVVFPRVLTVLNNAPSIPTVHLSPANATTTTELRIYASGSRDVEQSPITYRYQWYLNGESLEGMTGDCLDPNETTKHDNISVEVWAFDGDDKSPSTFAWVVIRNAPPVLWNPFPNVLLDEDAMDDETINLLKVFRDYDDDPLTFTISPIPENIMVKIDPETGQVTFTPEKDWFGEERVSIEVFDGENTTTTFIDVVVRGINDEPWFETVDGDPVTTDTLRYEVNQDEELLITFVAKDVEGHFVACQVNTSIIELNETSQTLRFKPGNEEVGTLRFSLSIWDAEMGAEKVTLYFIIEVMNENDPPGEPRITTPIVGSRFNVNQTFALMARCEDPDSVYGQSLNYSWYSNISGLLGYGGSLSVSISEPGDHLISLVVTDGEFTKEVSIPIIIMPVVIHDDGPIPNGEGEGPLNYGIIAAIIVVLVVIGTMFYVMTTKRHTEELEAEDEKEYKREHMERAHAAIKAAADTLENGKDDANVEVEAHEWEAMEIEVESEEVPSVGLSMEVTETEAPTRETMALFGTVASQSNGMSEEEHEQLRLENEKRKYQNAIGRLPYGIPSKELEDRDWVDLADTLATGEKRMTPDGRETTEIGGKWYYSDPNDTGSFLKEHGEPAKVEKPKEIDGIPDRKELLAKLEARFIMGEISEEAYNKLVVKYSDEEE
jgi:uncharacterized membrane protein